MSVNPSFSLKWPVSKIWRYAEYRCDCWLWWNEISFIDGASRNVDRLFLWWFSYIYRAFTNRFIVRMAGVFIEKNHFVVWFVSSRGKNWLKGPKGCSHSYRMSKSTKNPQIICDSWSWNWKHSRYTFHAHKFNAHEWEKPSRCYVKSSVKYKVYLCPNECRMAELWMFPFFFGRNPPIATWWFIDSMSTLATTTLMTMTLLCRFDEFSSFSCGFWFQTRKSLNGKRKIPHSH